MGTLLWRARFDPADDMIAAGMLRRLKLRFRAVLRRGVVEREMDEEMGYHLERATALGVSRGMAPDAARAAARREFGHADSIVEEARDARGVRLIEDLGQDVRYGARVLARSPGFTLVVVLTLALGFGVNTALFSIFKVAMRPTPVPDPGTLVDFRARWSYADYRFVGDRMRTLSSVFVRSPEWMVLGARTPGQEPDRISGEFVSANFFAELGGHPALGRTFAADETRIPGAAPVVVLSHRLWRSRFGADSSVVGETVHLAGGQSFTVIGVMPPNFAGADRHTPGLWLPLGMRPALPAFMLGSPNDGDWFDSSDSGRDFPWIQMQGRIAAGSGVEAVRTEARYLIEQLRNAADAEWAADAAELQTAEGSGLNSPQELLIALLVFGATTSVLLLACATVANLMLARAATRAREVGVRLSLGASRGRVVRQLLTESTLLAAAAGITGILLGWVCLRIVFVGGFAPAIVEDADPELLLRHMRPDAFTFIYTFLLVLLSAVLFGLAPAFRSTRPAMVDAMREMGASASDRFERSRLRSALIASQVALTMVLLLASGLLLRGLLHVTAIDTGFERGRTLAVQPALHLSGYDPARAQLFIEALETRLKATSGVRSVASGYVPVATAAKGEFSTDAASVPATGYFNGVSASFFETLGIPIVRGRAFTDAEVRQHAPVVIVSESTARALWPGLNPIGQVLTITPNQKAARFLPVSQLHDAVVVGVARDAQMVKLGQIDRIYAYSPSNDGTLIVRTDGPADRLVAPVRKMTTAIDPNLVVNVQRLRDMVGEDVLLGARLASGFAMTIGLLSMVMAVVGLFGLTAYSVAQRTREFGIRMAVGATRRDLVRLVTRQGLRLVLIGTAVGAAAGAAGSRVLSGLLFGLSPFDPVAYAGVALLLLAVTTLACYLPARAATRVDPANSLRSE